MPDISRWVYDRMPIAVQNAMCSVAGRRRNRTRYGPDFQSRVAFFQEAGRWPRARAEAYQLGQLRELAAYAYANVPYYRARFDAVGLKPEAIRALADFARLPMITKDEVRREGTNLIGQGVPVRSLVVSHSGGSTGMPLTCYHDRATIREVYAAFWAYHRPGVTPADPYATFAGMALVPPRQKGPPWWRMNRAMHQRLYSIFHLSEETVADYIADLDRYEPVYLAGYANSLYLLAALARERGLRPRARPRAVFSTSEQLLPEYRRTIEEVFAARVWDAYSQDEACASISEYECGHYHYDRAYGYIEFLDVEPCGNGRRLAEIVCTGLLGKAWPLLRYRVGDLVEYEDVESCPGCGRAGPVIHAIRGRTGDALVLPSGRRFPHISLIVKSLHGVRQVQLCQDRREAVTIRYVASDDFAAPADEAAMVAAFRRAAGEDVQWRAERMASIPRTRAGKFLSIICNVDPAPREAAAPRAPADARQDAAK